MAVIREPCSDAVDSSRCPIDRDLDVVGDEPLEHLDRAGLVLRTRARTRVPGGGCFVDRVAPVTVAFASGSRVSRCTSGTIPSGLAVVENLTWSTCC